MSPQVALFSAAFFYATRQDGFSCLIALWSGKRVWFNRAFRAPLRTATRKNMRMKMIIPTNLTFLSSTFALALLAPYAQAGTFSSDFEAGQPPNTALFGSATVVGTGGFTNSGCLQLTTATASQNGTFITTSDLDGGVAVVGFTASFKMTVGSSGGDGFSFNFATNIPAGGIT